jgi:hypothetical protein
MGEHSTTILGQDFKLILLGIENIENIESHPHSKGLLYSKQGQKHSFLGIPNKVATFSSTIENEEEVICGGS